MKQERAKKIEEMKKHIEMKKRFEQNEKIESLKDENNNVKIMKEKID